MLSWDDFRYVKAIADTRSLGGAAQELSVNHSTVFRRLAQIEKGLGSRLFERSRGGYALTPCGEEMVRLAERMGEDIAAFERQEKIDGVVVFPAANEDGAQVELFLGRQGSGIDPGGQIGLGQAYYVLSPNFA